MRKTASAIALFAAAAIVSGAQGDDFSTLLADLSFGDQPSVEAPLTLTTPPAQEQLQRAPDGLSMPQLSPGLISTPEGSAPLASAAPQAAPSVTPPSVTPPSVTLHSPISADPQRPLADVDLDAVFELHQSGTGTAAQVAGHLFGGKKHEECDEPYVCTPHTAPSLPTSSFYQYFRSNKCNSHVWDGYRQNCRSSNKHLNGTCDCFEPKEKKKWCQDCPPIYDAPVADCSPCQARPQHLGMPLQRSCDGPTGCDAPCDR